MPSVLIVIFVAILAYLSLAAAAIRYWFRLSRRHTVMRRLFGRSLVLALFAGLGFVPSLKFNLPTPAIASLLIVAPMGPLLFFKAALVPFAVSWLAWFLVLGLLEIGSTYFRTHKRQATVVGSVLFVIAMVSWIAALIVIIRLGWPWPWIVALSGLGVLALVEVFRREHGRTKST